MIHRATLSGGTACGVPGKISMSGVGVTCPECLKAETESRKTSAGRSASVDLAAGAVIGEIRKNRRGNFVDRIIELHVQTYTEEFVRSVIDHLEYWYPQESEDARRLYVVALRRAAERRIK